MKKCGGGIWIRNVAVGKKINKKGFEITQKKQNTKHNSNWVGYELWVPFGDSK